MPRVGTLEASSKTVRNRSNEVSSYRSTVTGGEGTLRQLGDEMRALPQEEREELMGVFAAPVSMPAESMLALKADLVIPWNKLRAMRRYVHNIINASALFPGSPLYTWQRYKRESGNRLQCKFIVELWEYRKLKIYGSNSCYSSP